MSYVLEYKELIPLLAVVVTALLGIFTFWTQKRAEQRAKHRLDVQERYEKYLHSIFEVLADPANKDRQAAFQKMQVSLRLFASSDVLRRAKEFEDRITKTHTSPSPTDLAAPIVNAMRDHVVSRKSDRISDSEMSALNSFTIK
jgi:hypothetical protein